MVDLKTAMAAAQAERRKRDGAKSDDKKKRRSGADLGIEPFDPVKYARKEKADTASMWLVIFYAFVVTMLMRFVLMPSTTLDKTDVLYLLPLTMMILIPQLHRIVMPERFKEHYTKGTWFRAFFLYTFTFLSLSFLVVNPPFGDIVAPKLAQDWGIAVMDDNGNFTYADDIKGGVEWTLEEGQYLPGSAWLLFGLADNVDETGVNVSIVHNFLGVKTSFDSNETFWSTYGDEVGTWKTANNKSAPIFLPHKELDQAFAINLGDGLAIGTHEIEVTITEEGDPWQNTRTYNWVFNVNPPTSSTE